MKRLQIPDAVALVVGLVMVILGGTPSLHPHDMASQTTGEFILCSALTVGGVLIALMAFFGLVRSVVTEMRRLLGRRSAKTSVGNHAGRHSNQV